jgi:hypothetical protein
MTSRRGFRVAVAALALAFLVSATPAAHGAPAGRLPAVAGAGSLWEQVVATIEARLGSVLELVRWNGPGSGKVKRGAVAPGTTISGGSPSGSGSTGDQSGAQDPNG